MVRSQMFSLKLYEIKPRVTVILKTLYTKTKYRFADFCLIFFQN